MVNKKNKFRVGPFYERKFFWVWSSPPFIHFFNNKYGEKMATKIILGGGGLTHEDLVTVSVHGAEVVLEPKMEKEVSTVRWLMFGGMQELIIFFFQSKTRGGIQIIPRFSWMYYPDYYGFT